MRENQGKKEEGRKENEILKEEGRREERRAKKRRGRERKEESMLYFEVRKMEINRKEWR